MSNLEDVLIPTVFYLQSPPDGFIIDKNEFGRCLRATKVFNAGDSMAVDYGKLVSQDLAKKFTLILGDERFECDTTHSVKLIESENRIVFGYDIFTNHSCDPNTYSIMLTKEKYAEIKVIDVSDEPRVYYETIARKSISIGDEISCDYCLFDYTCNGHTIPECLCGESICRDSCHGFKNLTLQQKVNLLPVIYPFILEAFLNNNQNVRIVDLFQLIGNNSNIEFKVDSNNEVIINLTKNVSNQEIIFSGNVIEFPENVTIIILKINENKYILLNLEKYLIKKNNHLVFEGIDVFAVSSDVSFIKSSHNDGHTYDIIAKKNLFINDTL